MYFSTKIAVIEISTFFYWFFIPASPREKWSVTAWIYCTCTINPVCILRQKLVTQIHKKGEVIGDVLVYFKPSSAGRAALPSFSARSTRNKQKIIWPYPKLGFLIQKIDRFLTGVQSTFIGSVLQGGHDMSDMPPGALESGLYRVRKNYIFKVFP